MLRLASVDSVMTASLLVMLGQKLDAHVQHLPAAEHQQHHGSCQRHGTVLQAPFQALDVLVLDLFKPDQPLGLGLFQHGGGSRRHHGDSHDAGTP